ncbi:DUF3465 domain-containing protein [Methylomonas sp. LL1]|uniref:DUF3465 domain-containing protein n=1 Tax=Methylomonas sp. LL1 TaxID=2785785 RepID=UPI0018C3760A|nr:DUF3465 domain-containing protein [Methylomonas sp. LL1]QPK62167.1 DUF3465 domain-containing protein [Methylomonas sp. LL1]
MNKVVLLAFSVLISLQQLVLADNSAADGLIEQAYRQQRSDLQIEGEGTVIKLLPDDNHGSRHQRFILRLNSGQTLLIAHNIDLADRIEALRIGDKVAFFGEYEWSEKGGTLHWTHHDPQRRHVGGWLQHAGRTYQ